MSAELLLSEGRLDDALAELKQQVRKDAANGRYRIFLFQLLAIQGNWARALTQLEVAGELDPGALAMVQTYREAIRCELLRADIFGGRRSPLIFGDPEPWLALLLEALQLTAADRHEQAEPLRNRAFTEAPATSGTLDGRGFEWIADADMRLGPILEAIVNGRFYWIPFRRIKSIKVEAPVDLRDMVWMPAFFTWANGGESAGLIPTRYPESERNPDPQIRMARKTDWQGAAPNVFFGQGQRMLATDTGDFSLMDIRSVELNVDREHEDASTPDADPPDG